ncbi:hypothetical protein [Prevotella koreensis]|uniref:SMI1/KNR4 family protein n=1 Tax=Prevotella koreensis TaxID=2490854 RepID=A0A3S0RAA3_9BACT|nr:hypothetical protein [Prevotella koreensis]RUL59187.1 hypothetical protein EHV08_05025 [Prevotella koreensis]
MTVEDFINKAKNQDSRNFFEPYTGDISSVPSGIVELYRKANPINVEIDTRKFGSIHFYPLEDLENLKNDYSFMPKDSFIFASNNGDPIFIENSRFYITYESRFNPEQLSDSFESFLDYIKIK